VLEKGQEKSAMRRKEGVKMEKVRLLGEPGLPLREKTGSAKGRKALE